MAQKLDDKTIKSLTAPAKGNRVTYDTEVKGFGVRVTAAGAKAFILNYRNKHGIDRRYTIGSVSDWSVVAARNEAKQLKREIDQGRDPMGDRHHDRQAPTMVELSDRYLAEHVDVHNKPRTRAENRRMVEQIIKPKLGRLKVEAVEHEDVERLHREMKKTPRQANHVVAVLSKMMNLAERWKLRPLGSNPCRHLQRYPENARDRYASPDELERIGAAMRELEGRLRPGEVNCIRFLALVGCRLNEAVELDLAHVNFKTGAWALPDAKAGQRSVMLGAPALALLASLERSGRVFDVTVDTVEHAWKAIRAKAGVPDLRLHDLRHTTGTYAGAAGLNAFIVRDLLGHKTMAMTGRYVSKHVDPLRAAADAISGQISASLEGKTGEVVQMPGRAAR